MLVLLDSNIFVSALLVPRSPLARIVDEWLEGRFELLTCRQQIDEIRRACRNPRLKNRLYPHQVGTMLNNLYKATVWQGPLPRKHHAADPADSYLLDLMEAAQPDCAVTGDKRAGLLERNTLGRTKILRAADFVKDVLYL